MGSEVLHRAVSCITGETITGTAAELAKVLKVTRGHIKKSEWQGSKIGTEWSISRIGYISDRETIYKGAIPTELFKEWDRVTEPFKVASRKKALC